jgi:hypothetical protein
MFNSSASFYLWLKVRISKRVKVKIAKNQESLMEGMLLGQFKGYV